MFKKILIANRGEIAVRIIKTCRKMGIKTVLVYSDADAGSLACEMADETIHIGPSPAAQSYLIQDKIVDAVRQSGAEAVHPGFGFLSENPVFARRLEAEGITFIGPNPHAIEAMGDKITSKKFAAEAGVSTVPGHMGLIESTEEAVKIANEIGYPVMIKASAGGGGKGIRVAHSDADMAEGFAAVKAEALTAFGDDRVFLEKFIVNPRHIEIQVLGDKHGNIVSLFDRECSIQRRNQKVIEEAPSPLLDDATRKAMGDQAVALARAVNYDSAGTVEFVAGQDRSFYFLEMNTRLQVEHPVTELITGVDLVEQMIRSAAGETMGFKQEDLSINGWAIESRIYAEDPYRGFLPSIGRLVRYEQPEEGDQGDYTVRNDSGVREGDEISMFYDPMIAKLCAWGETRDAAVEGMARALEDTHLSGLGHNVPFLSAVMDQDRFKSGELSTSYIKDEFPDGFRGLEPSEAQKDIFITVAAAMNEVLAEQAGDPSERTDWTVLIGREGHAVSLSYDEAEDLVISLDERDLTLSEIDWRPGMAQFRAVLDDEPFTAEVKRAPDGFDIRHRAARARVRVLTPRAAEMYQRLPEKIAADTSKLVLSPMPGLVVDIPVSVGQEVKSGETVAIIEAMKMQNILKAERDGVVKAVGAKAGDPVAADDVLVEFA
ncbi:MULTISPECIES: acetyl/propionyl/methylcrotonyl-CoA carboxylase subunit alpha [unclassified Brevundimonas]|uniref:acetyl-CoA carboxylase biotin carboxylase subunit n=1 Tax=unclassified Brevundimonas TaxID=2622653 RepID=UPI000CFBDFD2|nr:MULTISPECIES: acetyl/propionyl/methylcrotonyl-CoA carboxylase subunit alpha [unclassified Brevundimonas]PRA28958.1 acetyl/propionyl-CoA carboxylase subunit alpha [Brevundimonas sp. MYb27]PQZ84717.1 acetyl/propionyl-CoA carboxylase subunit alpha [Brevundimonas sp. MYb31]PRB12490.1 acetyl/propionyl-CoA carboxylase subunit alpha [Brevundimonas sp. MYb52]PRB32953.1 acetyl/propionyl-CoA carboxylase subunit alpha [Brevundimonas sp. MYb46]PRB50337.1 acetyl/propionyl-CoA carboxylase subunit alpha [